MSEVRSQSRMCRVEQAAPLGGFHLHVADITVSFYRATQYRPDTISVVACPRDSLDVSQVIDCGSISAAFALGKVLRKSPERFV
jgi:hypothetical protein